MLLRNILIVGFRVCALVAPVLIPTPLRADLQEYVRKPEAALEWQMTNQIDTAQSKDRIYDLQFVSQIWQGTKWQHQLQIYRPSGVAPNRTMFLWITGGSARVEDVYLGMELARKSRAPVGFLYHIPNQPLLEGNLYEDDLIAETF